MNDENTRTPALRMTRRGVIKMAGGLGAFAVLPGLPSLAFGAAKSVPSTAAETITAHFASTKTMAADFLQTGPNGEQAGGKLFIARPGKIRINYDGSECLRVISDGHSIFRGNLAATSAHLSKLSKSPLKFLLDDRIDVSGNNVGSVSENGDLTSLHLTDRAVFGDESITMMFDTKTGSLRQWTMTDAEGNDTTVMLSKIHRGVTFDPKIFEIESGQMLS